MSNNSISYENCLAKTEISENGQKRAGMTVLQHCVSSGMVASCIAEKFPYLQRAGLFPDGYSLIAALHDVGKVSPAFQYKILSALDDEEERMSISRLIGLDPSYHPRNGTPAHMAVSYSALYERYGEYVAYIEGIHHGGYENEPSESGMNEVDGGEAWQESRMLLADRLEETFGKNVPSLSYATGSLIKFLAGLTIVSDWLSSSITLDNEKGNASLDLIRHKVESAGFRRHEYVQGLSFEDIFSFSPRPEQLALIDAVERPGVYILEAGTGSGKTEAALYAAYRMLSSGFAEGVYFALPTAFTSKQIHKRLDAFLDRILVDGDRTGAKLVFSNSFLYSCVFEKGFTEPSWFDSRKRQILAPFAAGTIDQALMSVLRVRHSVVRTFGLAGKVVIIDEVHSYDTYTGNLIRRLVEELVQLGATVLILSATLRQKARNELLNLPSDHVLSSSYPCVTSFVDSKYSERSCDSSFRRTVIIEHEEDDMKAFDKAVDDAYDGKFVLWIENTVDEAQKAYGRFLARCGNEIRMELLHSRFLGSDRAKKESLVTRLWGKEGWSERKAGKGFILVGTQILEQSLDIDADVLYTRLAPADMLFQRMGRLWRHDHADRKGQPVCHVLHPPLASVIDNPDILAPSSYVYLPYVLYRTLSVFASISAVNIPDDIRSLLEAVYDDSFIAGEPGTVTKMRRELIEHREKLESLSNRAIGFAGQIMSDVMMPRYSDMKTCRVMILSSVNLTEKSVTLLDGEEVSLAFISDPGQRALVSLKLEENMFTVPASRCPQYASAFNDALNEMFSPFIYIPEDRTVEGDNAGLCILIKDEGRQLYDLSGNKMEKACYSQKMGYTFIR